MSKILIIEDDFHFQNILTVLLSRHGFEFEAVSEGQDALNLLSGGGFNLIVTDMNLPDMDGISLMHKIRETDTAIPIIAISGGRQFDRSDKSQLEEAVKLGARRSLQKPFEHSLLIEAIKEELARPS